MQFHVKRDCNLHMEFIKKLETYLISDDHIVQENIIHILKDYPYTPVEWTNRLLERALNSEENRSTILLIVDDLPLNEKSVQLLLKLLELPDVLGHFGIIRSMYNIEPELIVKYGNQLVDKKVLTNAFVDYCASILNENEDDVIQPFLIN
jgi:hypothetical protein